MNVLLNTWLLYQTIACRMGSVRLLPAGAYGFRDQLQDSLAVLHSRPDLTRARSSFTPVTSTKGDVHWWHGKPIAASVLTSRTITCGSHTVARYIEHTGDTGILEEVVPYLEDEPLQEGEYERYEPTCLSERSGTVLEHCLRAIDRGPGPVRRTRTAPDRSRRLERRP